MFTSNLRLVFLATVLSLLPARAPVLAQTPLSGGGAPAAAGTPAEPTRDPLGRTTPYGTVAGFLAAARNGDDQRAAQYLHTRARGADAAVLAHQLFVVLDRRMPGRLNLISNNPDGSTADGVPLNLDLIATIASEKGGVDILVERVDRKGPGSIWLFSEPTLAAIPELYDEVNARSPVELPAFLSYQVLGISLFEWLVVLVGLPLLYLLAALPIVLLGRAAGWLRRRFFRGAATTFEFPGGPVRLLLVVLAVRWLGFKMGRSLGARQFWGDVGAMVGVSAIVWLFIVLNGRCEQYIRCRLTGQNLAGMASVLRLARRAVDVIILAAGLFVVLHYFGVNPTAALAGLGVGGIAVALAAQKTLENVIAGVSLIMDQAVRVGDFLKVGDCSGTVDDIGLRSTRIRTMDRTVVSVPNGQIANMSLETMSARDMFWFHPLVRLGCDTTVAQIRAIVEAVRLLLSEHAGVDHQSVRVRFLGFGPTSLDVDVHAYVVARDWPGFLEIQEALLLRTMEIVQEAGARIAIPSQITYLAGQPPAGSSAVS